MQWTVRVVWASLISGTGTADVVEVIGMETDRNGLVKTQRRAPVDMRRPGGPGQDAVEGHWMCSCLRWRPVL